MRTAFDILVVDDEANMRRVLSALVRQAGHQPVACASAEDALECLGREDPALILTDLKMGGMDGLELLTEVRVSHPEIPVVMITAFATVDVAVSAMKRGAFDFVTKPFDRDKVLAVIDKALAQTSRARREFQGPLEPRARCGIIGESEPIEVLRNLIERAAPSATTILISGETGTGKELVADAIHACSARADGPMVRINCGALPDHLVESELFGHEKGAFTGAQQARPGRFELADGGTLFLDEVGELPSAAQVKLLRVLGDGKIDRIGSSEPRQVDVRLVAATNIDLEAAVREGRFRQDLLFRLKVIEIRVPPLRERLGDVPLLVDFFLDKYCQRLRRPRPGLEGDVGAWLGGREWPGNVRELENMVERALVLGESETLGPADFGDVSLLGAPAVSAPGEGMGLKQAARAAAAQTERRMIVASLEETAGNVTRAAEALGLSRRGLQLKMKELGLR